MAGAEGISAPAELRDLPGWLVWRSEAYPGEAKPRKVPYYTSGARRSGKQGSPEDLSKLVTFEAAKRTAEKGFDGVGLAMLPQWGIVGLDFDHCVGQDGRLPKEVEDIVSDTYAEYSPSGKGVRAFVKGSLGDHKSTVHQGWPWGYEVFSGRGFLTFTGRMLPFTEVLGLEDRIAPVSDKVTTLCQTRFGTARSTDLTPSDDFLLNHEPVMGLREQDILDLLSDLDPSMGRDEWIKVGMALHHETGGEGFDLWNDWSSDGYQYPGTEALRTQWQSFDRRDPASRQITLRTVRRMSNDARSAKGLLPRSFDLINRAAEEARTTTLEISSDRYASSDDWTGKYRVYSGGEFTARPAPKWIIKGVLPEADLGVIYGQSGSGKSFAILDMMLSICRGEPWRGLKVRQGRVLYVAAEGGGGVSQRLKAYEQHHGVKIGKLPLGIIHDAPNLLLEEDVSELVKAIVNAGSGDIIVLDTLAQMTPGGNENSGEDMGLALSHCRAIRAATGSMVVLVHHSGKDQSKGARGWSGLRGATDVELEVTYEKGDPVRVLRVSKQKDGRDDMAWAFRLQEVPVGMDDDGEIESSMVVVEAEMQITEEPGKDKRKHGIWERQVMDFIATLEPTITSIQKNELVDMVAEIAPPPEAGKRDYRKQNVIRALNSLSTGKDALLAIEHGLVTFLSDL